jgi:GNAT superfamily N-acetyltransferase
MTRADLPFADAVRSLVRWNQTLADWERFLAQEPHGCFVAEWEGMPAGTVTTTCYGVALGWIGMLLVHPDRRHCGIGTALLQHAMSSLRDRGVLNMKLDATPQGQPLYEGLGFQAEEPLARWQGQTLPAEPCSRWVRPLVANDSSWPALSKLDAGAFGISRERMLKDLAEQSVLCVTGSWPDGSTGFGMLREGARAYYLGPAAASSATAGADIVRHLLSYRAERPVFWDVLNGNEAARSLAAAFGFSIQRPLLRMRFGTQPLPYCVERQYAIADPAVG